MGNKIFIRMLLTLLLTALTAVTVTATDFYTDVMVIGGTAEEVTAKTTELKAQGWTRIEYDLNKGCGGSSDYIYLLYKKESSADDISYGDYITDFYIKSGTWPHPETITYNGRTYHLVPYDGGDHFKSQVGDLNSNTGANSASIHLYYTKESFSDDRAVTYIGFNDTKSGAVGENGGSDGYDLNAGCGSSSAYIYMHLSTSSAYPPFSGSGTAQRPFSIGSDTEWTRLAKCVSKGLHTDKYFKQTGNFQASTMVGSSAHPFCGVFDGAGGTITLSISSAEAGAAPFHFINGATIKNLTVEGSVTGSGYHAAGLVGVCSGGPNLISNCHVFATVNGAGYAGGFVGHGGSSTLTIENSYFAGTISGFNVYAGGLLGWCEDMTVTMKNCLFKGSFSPASGGTYHPIACKLPEKNVSATFTSTYYLNTLTPTAYFFGDADKQLSTTSVAGSWDIPVTAADGVTYYGRTYGFDLPYSYGFENNDLNAAGWNIVDSNVSRIVSDDGNMYGAPGQYCLRISLGDQPHYLISPELKGQSAISMRYSQRLEYSGANNAPIYRVGYSTYNNEISSFVWGNWQQCSSTAWTREQRDFPMKTKYIAFEFGTNSGAFVLDEFAFSACETPAPQGLTLTGITDVSAQLSWETPGTDAVITGYAWQYKKASDSNWSTEVTTSPIERTATITGLSGYTDYDFRVKALYAVGTSSVYSPLSFRTSMSLPFECGFENDGDLGKWTMTDVYWDRTKVYDVRSYEGADQMYACPYNGNRNFTFYSIDKNPHPQYLISPQFNGTTPIQVSFYYRNRQADVWDTFQVGVSYSDNDISSFSWGPEIGALNGEWRYYDNQFLGGERKPRYIAIKYTGNRECLFVDDVIFCEASTSAKPTNLTVSSVTNRSATLTWKAPSGATGYAYRYKLATGDSWSEGTVTSASVTLTGLSASTIYDFRLKALYNSAPASNETEIRFLTEGDPQALPFYERFDSGLGGWRLVNGDGDSRLKVEDGEFINAYFVFAPYFENQYLISPELASDKAILASFFYKEVTDIDTKVTKVRAGWSTSTKDTLSFTWGPEVEATSVLQNYTIQAPQGTRYFAIRKTDDGHFLYVDDISLIDASQYSIEAAPAVVFGENKFVTTFYHLNFSFELPEGSRAYTAFLDGKDVVFRLIGDDGRIVPFDTPCIIISDPLPSDSGATSKTLVLKPLLSTDVQAHEGNVLRGYSVDIISIYEKVAGNYIYVLDIVNGVLGFYRFVGDRIPPRKVFILLPQQ